MCRWVGKRLAAPAGAPLVDAAVGQTEGYGHLSLITYDDRGWWEHNGVVSQVEEPFEPAQCVVRLHELAGVLEANSGPLGAVEPEIEFHVRGVVVDGSTVTATSDEALVPPLPKTSMPVDEFSLPSEVTIRAAVLGIETQIGRLGLSLDLVRHLVERGISYGRVVEAQEEPYISGETTIPMRGPMAPIVLGEVDVLRQGDSFAAGSGPVLEERRVSRGDEVAELLMATSPTTPAEDLLRLFDVGVGYVRRRVAAHGRLPAEVVNTISREGTEALRAAAAANPSLPEEAAQRLHQDQSGLVRAALAANRSTPALLLAKLGSDPVPEVRAGAAGNPRTPEGLLEQLANDVEPVVREGAGRNIAISPKTLHRLATDSDTDVCAVVASNPHCPTDMLQELGHVLPQYVLVNPSAPARLLAAACSVRPRAAAEGRGTGRLRPRSSRRWRTIPTTGSSRPSSSTGRRRAGTRRHIEQRLAARGSTEAPDAPDIEGTRGFAPRPGPRESSPEATSNGHALHDPAV